MMPRIEISEDTLEDLKALYKEGETYDRQIRRLIMERSEALDHIEILLNKRRLSPDG